MNETPSTGPAGALSGLEQRVREANLRWAVTGVAGFIGSNLAETLLSLGQDVVGLDDLSTGSRRNVDYLSKFAAADGHGAFDFIEGSILDPDSCGALCRRAEVVLHQAALGSIPRSIEDPLRTNAVNVTGTLNMLLAARDAGRTRFVYASSSSVYGDDPGLPKVEPRRGRPLAPYATSKVAGELYARNFARHFGLETVGLRYFNVFGPRQDPCGPYAAVIPKWIAQLADGQAVTINGDGSTSRDFCFVANVVQANLLAALWRDYDPEESVFNVAVGGRTTLTQLYGYIARLLEDSGAKEIPPPVYGPPRIGDITHSEADISRARSRLGYEPSHDMMSGLRETVSWFLAGSRPPPAG